MWPSIRCVARAYSRPADAYHPPSSLRHPKTRSSPRPSVISGLGERETWRKGYEKISIDTKARYCMRWGDANNRLWGSSHVYRQGEGLSTGVGRDATGVNIDYLVTGKERKHVSEPKHKMP